MDQKHIPDGPTPSRYKWQFQGATFDFYRLCEIIGVTSDPAKHAMKKIIRAGKSVKPIEQDITEAIDALLRWKEMLQEDAQPMNTLKIGTSIGRACDIVAWKKAETACAEDGWIPWSGGECPVRPNDYVDYKMRDGSSDSFLALKLTWNHRDEDDDIVAYRIA